MPYVTGKNGYRYHQLSWQMSPGSGMKRMNQAASSGAAGSALFGSIADHGAGMTQLIAQMAAQRVQEAAKAKLDAQRTTILNGLNVTA